jgi:hypothetical protein
MGSTIGRHPIIARNIGFYITTFSEVEVLLTCAFAAAIGDSGSLASAILHQFRNLNDRIKVVQDVITASPSSTPGDKLLKIRPAFSKAQQFRNTIAHGIFDEDEEGNPFMWAWVAAKGRSGDRIPMTEDRFILETKNLMSLHEALIDCFKGTPVTFPYKLKESSQVKQK